MGTNTAPTNKPKTTETDNAPVRSRLGHRPGDVPHRAGDVRHLGETRKIRKLRKNRTLRKIRKTFNLNINQLKPKKTMIKFTVIPRKNILSEEILYYAQIK